MSENTPAEVPASALGPLRTLAVRITDGLRAQLDVLAQLNDRTVTEEIRLAERNRGHLRWPQRRQDAAPVFGLRLTAVRHTGRSACSGLSASQRSSRTVGTPISARAYAT